MEQNFKRITSTIFPTYLGIDINMMPFIMGDIESIPHEYQHYYPLIKACNIPEAELGKVGYLSIMESLVLKGETQRRPGVHIERPSNESSWGGWGGGSSWGGAGGLYMGSNIDNMCRVWNKYIQSPGPLGDCSHLVNSLGEPTLLKGNEIYWMHDRCPHESISIDRDVFRQWFRVVTSDVGSWYSQHSTANRLGVEPGCQIITTSKF